MPPAPTPPPRKRSKAPHPFAGLIHKPLCAACEQATDSPPKAPDVPPPLIASTRGRQRTVDTQEQFCPGPDCSYTSSTCPDCREPTHRIHGHYRRTLADLPWATAPIELRVIVRRFRCRTGTCRRQTFAERLPSVAPRYARTTTRLATTQANTGLALGGAAGARHLSRHRLPGSRNTLLRRVRSVSLPEGPAPEIIGVDDWAWRKGHRYGTIIVDLQRGCPIDVLEDRAAETMATWLHAHPDVTIVARDRAEASAAGIRQGAPEATQVADRFHLLKNLAAALQEVFSAHHRKLDQRNHLPHNAPPAQEADAVTVPPAPSVTLTKAQQQIAHTRATRVAEYAQARTLHQQGWTMKAIWGFLPTPRLVK